MKKFLITCLAVLSLSASAFAADLSGAKAAGYLGERPDGYLGVVSAGAPVDAKALAADVNAKRKAEYEQIAAKNHITLEAAEKVAGEHNVAKTAPGNFVMTPSGAWVKK